MRVGKGGLRKESTVSRAQQVRAEQNALREAGPAAQGLMGLGGRFSFIPDKMNITGLGLGRDVTWFKYFKNHFSCYLKMRFFQWDMCASQLAVAAY